MGIRVHKELGWALTDVRHEEYEIADSRINSESFLFRSIYDKNARTIEQFIDWIMVHPSEDRASLALVNFLRQDINDTHRIANILEKNGEGEAAKRMRRELDRYSPHKCVTWRLQSSENPGEQEEVPPPEEQRGNDGFLLIRPPSQYEWSRYDDPMDWIEETFLRVVPENWFEILKDAPFPYNALFMNAKTGEVAKGDATYWHNLTHSSKLTYEGNEEFLDNLAQRSGFDDHLDALQHCVPRVTEEVKKLCEWGELFTDDTVWRQLRPALHVYWD